MRMLSLIACAAILGAAPLDAQERPAPAQVQGYTIRASDQNRAVIGIGTRSGGAEDTLGVRVVSVTPGGPAERAGITEGTRIVAVSVAGRTPSTVNLRLSREDALAGDMGDVLSRRLQRTLAALDPGDEVTLRIIANGSTRDVRVRTVAASELPRQTQPLIRITPADPQRPMLGVTLGGTGTARDTLGLFISSVTRGGPAEQAGIVEGNRIAEINGVSVRVPREDAGDQAMARAMHARFTRELRNAQPGQAVRLRVWADGRYRDVSVTAVAASELRGTGIFDGIEILPGMVPERIEIIRGMEGPLREMEQRARETAERARMLQVRGLRPVRQI